MPTAAMGSTAVAGAATVVLGAAVIACQQGRRHPYGGQGDHILIGCSTVAGALHSDDRLDGRTSIGTMGRGLCLRLPPCVRD